MSVPLFSDKWSGAATYTPAVFLDHLRANGWTPGVVPDSVIYTYSRLELFLATQPDLFTPNHMLGAGPGRFFLIDATDNRVAINCLGTGPSATANQLELQAELGVRRIMILGTAGGLADDLRPGDIVVPTEAVRGDGTSDHYAPPEVPAAPSPQLADGYAEHLATLGFTPRRGLTWTTAAPFRTTSEEVEYYAGHGVLTVEEEVAALFAAADHRGLGAAAGLVVDGAPSPSNSWNVDLAAAGAVLRNLLQPTIDYLAV